MIALADAALVFIGLTILQVPLAPALAAVVFLGAFIPVIGAPIATFFAAIVALAERGPVVALLVIALTVVVGSADGHILQPLIMGKAEHLHPLAIIVVLAIGSVTMGIVGALIAVPVPLLSTAWRNSSPVETRIIRTRLPLCDQGSPGLDAMGTSRLWAGDPP